MPYELKMCDEIGFEYVRPRKFMWCSLKVKIPLLTNGLNSDLKPTFILLPILKDNVRPCRGEGVYRGL